MKWLESLETKSNKRALIVLQRKSRKTAPGFFVPPGLNDLNGLHAFEFYTRKNRFALSPSTLAFSPCVKSGRSTVS